MIGFRRQEELVVEVADGLMHATASSSYNLVVPPGFGEAVLADQIAARLADHQPRPLVAVLSPDTVKGVDDYIARLHAQWSENLHLPPIRDNVEADATLKRLLHTLPPGRAAVQIVKRFHKILDSLDRFVLGALRDAENSKKLRTVTLSPFGYDELKKRWERAGHILVASDYGDTHSIREVEPLSAQDICVTLRARGRPPMHVIELAVALTGGYPEPFQAVIDQWVRMKEPPLTPDVRRELRAVAVHRMRPLVRKLDRPGDQRYRNLVVDLHQGVDTEDALHALIHHPWSGVLLREEGLRAEALGDAAVDAIIADAVNEQRDGGLPGALLARARGLYERKQYTAVLQLLTATDRLASPGALKLLEAHARAMAILYAGEGSETGVDTDWGRLRLAVSEARALLAPLSSKVAGAAQVEERYQELEILAEQINRSTRNGNPRIVDALAGFHGTGPDARTALLLLLLKLETGRALAGHTSACLSVLALPEQVFRVWALWSLGLDFYQAPSEADTTWRLAENAWPHGALTRTDPGAQFASFESFAYFAVARLQNSSTNAAPENDFKMLSRSLSVLSIRRDAAHALTLATAKTRTQLFQLIDRWFDALLAPCDAHEGFTREELLAQVEPLPILDENGSLLWLG